MKKDGFASMYIVYSFFLIFTIMILSMMMLNNYKRTFLTVLKNDIKEELENYQNYYTSSPQNNENIE